MPTAWPDIRARGPRPGPGVTDGPIFDAAILGAAQEFAAFEPGLYKTHVPTLGIATDIEITGRSEAISAAIGRPWDAAFESVASGQGLKTLLRIGAAQPWGQHAG